MTFISRSRIRLARISRGVALAGLYILFLSAMLVSVDVIVRKVFGIAMVGSDELGGYALALATAWALSYAFFEGSHIRVNVIHMNLPLPAKAWLDVLTVLVTAAMIGLLAWQVWVVAFDSLVFDAASNTPLRLPLWIPQFLYLGGIVLFLLSAVVVLLESLGLALKRDYEKVIHLVEEREQAGEYTL